eukprot:SAG31_NODE_2509_length_5588_cov_2.936170_4_plen_606_part_01
MYGISVTQEDTDVPSWCWLAPSTLECQQTCGTRVAAVCKRFWQNWTASDPPEASVGAPVRPSIDGSWYKVFKRRAAAQAQDNAFTILPASYSFMDAERTCQKLGGHLASFHSDEDIAAALQIHWIWGTESDRGLWIGLNQLGGRELAKRSYYRWTDSSYLDFGTDRWHTGQPSGNSVSQCAVLRTNGQFDVRECNTEQEALCKLDGYTLTHNLDQLPNVTVLSGPGVDDRGNPEAFIDMNHEPSEWRNSPQGWTRGCSERDSVSEGRHRYLTVDLGNNYQITGVTIWHYYGNARRYCNQKIALSTANLFEGEEVVVYDTGTEYGPTESPDGNVHIFSETVARYVRHWCGGNTLNDFAHFMEIDIYGNPNSVSHEYSFRSTYEADGDVGQHRAVAAVQRQGLYSISATTLDGQQVPAHIVQVEAAECSHLEISTADGTACQCRPGCGATATGCAFCPAGFRPPSKHDITERCIQCADGRVSSDGLACTQCGPGTVPAADPRSHFVACAVCDTDEVSPDGTSCTQCSDRLVPNENATSCVECPRNSIEDPQRGGSCRVCQDGTTPSHDCIHVDIPLPQHGFPTEASGISHKCEDQSPSVISSIAPYLA